MSFLSLSKLLPLFFYPLGIACVLLLVTLFLSWRRSALAPLGVALALIVLLIGSNGWVNSYLLRSLEWQYLPTEIPSAEAIIVLGGATKSALAPRPMVDVNEQGDRVIYGAKLYQDGKAPLIIVSGGRIDWLSKGQPESTDMTQLLQMMGVPSQAIIEEPDSLNTYQNAVNVQQILAERDIKRVLLVTSAFHMPRSVAIFKRQGIDVIPAPTDFLVTQVDLAEPESTQSIIINLLPDAGRLASTTKAIKEYIGIFVYWLKGWL